MFDKQLKQLEILEPLINEIKNDDIKLQYNFLYERIKNPSTYLVFMGKTSSGKSSIINGFLGDEILPVSTAPSTTRVTEIVLDKSVAETQYYEFLNNLKEYKIPAADFIDYSKSPKEDVARFKILTKVEDDKFNNLSIFDTPGFGSADFKNHDEILKEFLPNSDIVVYTVSYIGGGGISVMDLPYLGYATNLLQREVETILLINRCPENINENDKRINEIHKLFTDNTGIEPKMFFIKDMSQENVRHPLPKCPELWEYILSLVHSEKRQKLLENAFDYLISNLFQRCKNDIEYRYGKNATPIEQYQAICKKASETASALRNLIKTEIEPTYDKLIDTVPRLLDKAEKNITEELVSRIQNTDNSKMDETKVMILSHLLPFNVRIEARKIQDYCSEVLKDLNRKCKDYINKELQNFNDQVYIITNSNTEEAVKNLGRNIIQDVLNSYVEKQLVQKSSQILIQDGIKYTSNQFLNKTAGQFAQKTTQQFISNSSSKLASEVVMQSSDDVGRVLFSQIGANISKAINVGIAVVIELFTLGIDLATWKSKLCNAVEKAISSWKEEALSILKDIEKSKELNKKTFEDFANRWEKESIPQKDSRTINYEKLIVVLKETENKLGE